MGSLYGLLPFSFDFHSMLDYHITYDPLVTTSFLSIQLIVFYHKFSMESCLILSFLDYNIACEFLFSVNGTTNIFSFKETNRVYHNLKLSPFLRHSFNEKGVGVGSDLWCICILYFNYINIQQGRL